MFSEHDIPSRENPLEAGKIKIFPDSFYFENKVYSISEIQHISFSWVKSFTGSIGPIKGDAGANMEMSIALKQSPVSISSRVSTYSRHDDIKFDKFLAGYKYLASTSFDQRYSLYVDELNKNGFINYDNKKIFKNGNVQWLGIELNIYKHNVLKGPFSLEIIYTTSAIEKFKWTIRHPLLPPNITIKTEMDQDVLFVILKNIFGISWK